MGPPDEERRPAAEPDGAREVTGEGTHLNTTTVVQHLDRLFGALEGQRAELARIASVLERVVDEDGGLLVTS